MSRMIGGGEAAGCNPWFFCSFSFSSNFLVNLLGWGNFETDNRRRRCNPWCTLCACHRQVQDGRRKKCNFQRKKTREGNKREKAATLECVKRSWSCCMDFFPRLFLHFPTATNKREKATTLGSVTLHFFSNSCTLRCCTLFHSRIRALFSLNCNFKGTAVLSSPRFFWSSGVFCKQWTSASR